MYIKECLNRLEMYNVGLKTQPQRACNRRAGLTELFVNKKVFRSYRLDVASLIVIARARFFTVFFKKIIFAHTPIYQRSIA